MIESPSQFYLDTLPNRGTAGEFQLLLNSGSACKNSNQIYTFLKASLDGAADEVQELLEQGMDPNSTDYDQRTALHLAVCGRQDQVIRLLIDARADAMVQDRWGNTNYPVGG